MTFYLFHMQLTKTHLHRLVTKAYTSVNTIGNSSTWLTLFVQNTITHSHHYDSSSQ